jgi:hypothetical protein
MTRSEIVAQIQLLLGFRTDLTTTITAQIAIQQNHLERDVQWAIYPWFLQTERAGTVVTATVDGFDERVLKPVDWIADMEEDGLWVTDEDGFEHLLIKSEENKLRNTFRESDPALPEFYSSSGDYYRLFPTPDAAYTLRQRYYQRDEVILTDVGENRWMRYAPNMLIGRVGLFLSGASENARRDMFSAMMQESKTAIERKSFDELTVNRQYAMGENF